MKTYQGAGERLPAVPASAYALVWIDSLQARMVRWQDGPRLTVITSDVPPHRRSTGHVHVDPLAGHGGAGGASDAPDAQRLAHLERFLGLVAAELEGSYDVEILGPGTVREHLARLLRGPRRPTGARVVRTSAAAPMTERQLVAHLRARVGEAPRRRPVGTGL